MEVCIHKHNLSLALA